MLDDCVIEVHDKPLDLIPDNLTQDVSVDKYEIQKYELKNALLNYGNEDYFLHEKAPHGLGCPSWILREMIKVAILILDTS